MNPMTRENPAASRLPSRRPRGFTLIELMITVVVIGILAAIAMPIYLHQVREARRTEARNALLELASREERYFATNSQYTDVAASLGYSSSGNTQWPVTLDSGFYQIEVYKVDNTQNPPYFELGVTVVPGTDQANDTSCQSFWVDSTGKEWSTNSTSPTATDTTSTCWPDATQ